MLALVRTTDASNVKLKRYRRKPSVDQKMLAAHSIDEPFGEIAISNEVRLRSSDFARFKSRNSHRKRQTTTFVERSSLKITAKNSDESFVQAAPEDDKPVPLCIGVA